MNLIKIIQWDEIDTTSCTKCRRYYKPKREIVPYLNFCSHKCELEYAFSYLLEMPKEHLVKVCSHCELKIKRAVFDKSTIFKIAKKAAQVGLHSINLLAHGSTKNEPAQKHELLSAHFTGSSTPYKGGEPMSREPVNGAAHFEPMSRQEVLR